MKRYDAKAKWRKLVLEAKKLLVEAEKEPREDGEDSLDNQVDRFLSDYEAEAKSVKKESRDWRMTVRRIIEAEGDEEESGAEKSEEETEEEPKKLSGDDINVDSFVNSVVRLVDNYDSLLEVRNTILRRATNYIGKNYEPDVVNQFKEKLLDQHGLSIGKSPEDIVDDKFPSPPAARSGGTGGGAA
jgi:hypothetical protein